MLIRDRRHPYGYHVDRHPPRRSEAMAHWMLVALAAAGVSLIVLFQLYSSF
jgi:hypothetical protein